MARKSDIRLRRSNVANAVPGGADLNEGELAINTMDGALYFKKSNGTIITGHDDTIMHIDSDNNRVGIGTTSPGHPLDIHSGTGDWSLRALSTDAKSGIVIADNNTANYIMSQSYTLSLGNQPSLHAANLNIKSTGLVGVGIINPALQSGGHGLHIHDDANSEIKFTNDTTGATASDGTALVTSGSSFSINNREAGLLHFGTSNTTRMSIDTSGQVGIGTQSPDRKLHISGSGGTVAFKAEATDTSQASVDLKTSNSWFRMISSSGTLSFYDQADSAERLRIDTSGKVGIGTNSPSHLLHVTGADGSIANMVVNNDNVALRMSAYTNSHGEIRVETNHPLVFKTNGNNERMRLTSSGFLGIGTNNPTSALEVNGTIRTDLIQTTTTSMSAFSFLNLDMDTGASSGTNNVALASVNNMDFLIDTNNNSTTGAFVFGTNGNTMASATQLMRLTESGNLGIGTNNPVTKLHVANGSDASDAVRISGGHASRYLAIKTFESNSLVGAGIILNASSSGGAFKFQTTSTNRMVIDHTGKVGIGTDSPQSNLHVNAGAGGGVTLEANANIDIDFRYRSGGVNKYNVAYDASAGSLIWYDNTANATRMVLDSSGNVGIGTATPGARLEILSDGSAAGGAEIRLQHANNNTNDIVSTVNFANNAGSIAMIQGGTTGANNNGYISFFTDNAGSSAEKMRILSNGNVGIGTASPDRQLELEGQGVLRLNATGSNADPGIDFNTANTNDMQIRYRGATDKLAIYSYGTTTDVVTIQKSDGNVGIGQANPGQKLTVDGNIRADGHYYVGGVITTTSSRGFNAADGTASAPTHTFHSDQDTGMYRIGANHLGFATGGSSRWSIDSSGGITQNGGSNYDYSGGGNFSIRHLAANQNITFATKNSSNALSEKMRIRGDGNVGIGTSVPPQKLSVHGAVFISANLTSPGSAGSYTYNGTAVDYNNNGTRYWSWGSGTARGTFDFIQLENDGTNQQTAMSINASGNVGIGTSSPDRKLEVDFTGSTVGARFTRSDTTGSSTIEFANSGGVKNVIGFNAGTNNFDIQNGGAVRLVVDNIGRVGIGTDNPLDLLHIKSSSTDARLVLDAASGADPEVKFFEAGNVKYTVGHDAATSKFVIGTANVDTQKRFTINSSGAITFNEAFTFPNADGSANQLLQTDGSGNMSWVTVSGVGTPTYIADADGDTKVQVEESADEDKIRFDIAGTQKMFLDSGELNLDGNLSVSGNLLIAGDINSTSVTNLDVTDKTITIANNAGSAANANGAGIVVDTSGTNPSLTYTSTNDEWNFNKNLVVGGKETTASFPLMVKSNTTHQGIHIEENSGTESYQIGVDASGDLNFYNSGNTTPILKLNDTNNLVLGHTSYTAQSSQNIGGNTDRFMAVTSNTAGQTVGYHLGVNDGSRNSRVKLFMTDDATAANRAFGIHQTWSSGGSMPFVINMGTNERLRIDTSGHVGIGTNNPIDNLHISGGNILLENNLELRQKDTGGTIRTLVRVNSSNQLQYGWSANAPVLFMGGGSYTERMRIHNTNGYIGIGEIDPDKKLHVKDSNYRVAVFERTGAANAHIILRDPNTTQDVGIGATTNDLKFRAGNADHITILGSNGHLRFTDFDQKVEFGGTGNTFGYSLWNMSASGGGQIRNVAGHLIINPDNYTSFQVNDVEHARLDGSNFDIESGGFRVNDPGNNYPFAITQYGYMTTRSSSITQLNGTDHANVPLSVLADVNTTRTASYVEVGDIGSAGNRFKIDSAGNVGIGTTSPAAKLHISGNSDVSDEDCMLIIDDVDGSAGSRIPAIMFRSNTGGTVTNQGRIRGTDSQGMILSGSSALGKDLVVQAGMIGIGTPSNTTFDSNITAYHAPTGSSIKALLKLWTNTSDNSGNRGGAIEWVGSGDKTAVGSKIAATRVAAGGKMDMRFYTGRNTDSNYEKMRIDENGNIGIGTTSPSHLLDILKTGSGDATINIKSTTGGDPTIIFNSAAANRSGLIKYQDNGTNVGRIEYVHNGDRIDFQAGSATSATMSVANGKVGIGTTSPNYKLHIKETAANAGGIFVEDGTSWFRVVPNLGGSGFNPMSTAGDIGLIFSNDNDSTTNSSTNGLLIAPHSTSGQGIKILEDGRVGIATTTPNSRFTVNVGSQGDGIELQSSEVSIAKLSRTTYSSTVVASLDGVTGRPIHIGGIVNEDVLIANAGGKVGIGTVTLTNKFHVSGNARIEGNLMAGDAAASNVPARPIHVKSTGDAAAIRIEDSTSSNKVYDIRSTHGEGLHFVDVTGGTTPMTLTTAGQVAINAGTARTTGGTARLTISDSASCINMGPSNSDLMYIRRIGAGQFQMQTYNNNNSGNIELQPYGGKVGIGTGSSSNPQATFQVEEYGIDTTTSSTTATTQVAIHSMSATAFRSARFTIQITNTTDSTYHSTEILAIHDGTTANITEFGEVHTGSSVEATFDADVNSGNFRLLATPSSTNSMTFKVVCHSLTV